MKNYRVPALAVLAGGMAGAWAMGKADGKKIRKAKELSEKHLSLFLMMNQWVKEKQEGKNLGDYFERHGIHRIAVYGMSYAGKTLLRELKGTNVEAAYGIDERAGALYADVKIVSADDNLDKVDAIVVTAITCFEEIEEKLCKKVTCPVISLEKILYEM